ncbi:elongation of fatty acids protein 3-like [Phalaenopsis equestris]|uniref:elongation of fatty acids protein 3-like n=1 Tax=Phalaenopsis equestris TaxID=78828 RepID=UPI0009E3D7BB|nr:elongation of fatty acids protein 3-like [Phalaenopsis equestris]
MGSSKGITFYLAEHPSIVGFRWSPEKSWGSTWSFLICSIALYHAAAILLHLLLHLFRRRRPVPLGPIPALHSLAMVLTSATIFLGILLSSLAEIRDTRWFWRRIQISNPLHWFLCFPIGTRPSGRVFFWSYVFYLSRFLHLMRSFFSILRRRPNAFSRLFAHSALVCMSFLWLEFSQSFQVLAILSSTLAHVVVFGYRFWVGVGLPVAEGAGFVVVLGCQVAVLCCNLICHFGVILLHFGRGGCSGIGAWMFNSFLNAGLLVVFLNFYVLKKGIEEEDLGNGRQAEESIMAAQETTAAAKEE